MSITTTDVTTNVTSSEVIKNSTCIINCTNTGEFQTLNPTYETSMTYNQIEDLYTSRFDNIAYYNAVDGGTP